MPQLLIRGIKPEDVCKISTKLIQELADICECDTENIILECIHSTSIYNGQIVETFPFIEVAWFERGAKIRDQFATAITRHVMSIDIPEVEVAFSVFREDSYYINGERCL